MSKKIINVSLWSWKSLISLYSTAITLLFAFFCVASGQIIKTASVNGTIKSRVLFASDSTPLKNIKLYLSKVMYPLYGIISPIPYLEKKDTTYSDSNGYFKLPDTIKTCDYKIATESILSGKTTTFYLSNEVYCPKGKDSVITLHMMQQIYTGVKNHIASGTTVLPYTAIQGGIVTIKILELAGENSRASIVNIKGEVVNHLAVVNGDIHWNTESVAKGIYFLDIENNANHLNVKIMVK